PLGALLPLTTVHAAIVDAARGTANPAFVPARTPKGGSPPKPVQQDDIEQLLAAVAECCVRHVRDTGQRPYLIPATELAAKLVNDSQCGLLVTATQMREYRERIKQLPTGSLDRGAYDVILQRLALEGTPLELAKRLLADDLMKAGPR